MGTPSPSRFPLTFPAVFVSLFPFPLSPFPPFQNVAFTPPYTDRGGPGSKKRPPNALTTTDEL